jgi:hypothetical protein
LEVTKVKARQHFARSVPALVFGLLIQGSAGEAEAQQQTLTRGQTAGPRFMVPVFRSNERSVGAQFADQLRDRMGGDFMMRTLWIIVKSDIESALVSSGYSTTEAVNSNDAKQLANIVRAEEYVEGAINKVDTGYEFNGVLLLVRGDGMVQPLPRITGGYDVMKGSMLSGRAQAGSEELRGGARTSFDISQTRRRHARVPEFRDSSVCRWKSQPQKWGADSIVKIGEDHRHSSDNRGPSSWLTHTAKRSRMTSTSRPLPSCWQPIQPIRGSGSA